MLLFKKIIVNLHKKYINKCENPKYLSLMKIDELMETEKLVERLVMRPTEMLK